MKETNDKYLKDSARFDRECMEQEQSKDGDHSVGHRAETARGQIPNTPWKTPVQKNLDNRIYKSRQTLYNVYIAGEADLPHDW